MLLIFKLIEGGRIKTAPVITDCQAGWPVVELNPNAGLAGPGMFLDVG